MAYIDGFVIAVPTANKAKFIEHAKMADSVFLEHGATRVLETWGDDVKAGKQTDFQRAVQAKDDETVVFSWIEWPDKVTRDAAMEKVMEDPRLDPKTNPMPFDGMRLIFGGFTPVVELGNLAPETPPLPGTLRCGKCARQSDRHARTSGDRVATEASASRLEARL